MINYESTFCLWYTATANAAYVKAALASHTYCNTHCIQWSMCETGLTNTENAFQVDIKNNYLHSWRRNGLWMALKRAFGFALMSFPVSLGRSTDWMLAAV